MKKKGKKRGYYARLKARHKKGEAETVPTQAGAAAHTDAAFPDAKKTAILNLIAKVGTGLWRMRPKLVNPNTNEPHENMRGVYRNFESVWDSIYQAEVKIQDHTNDFYVSGMGLNVISFQPTAGIEREVVMETLKPTIYFEGRMIQMGEVIVAIPDMNA